VAVLSAGLIGLAFAVGRRPRPLIDRPAPRPWLVAVVALAASFLFGWRGESWSGVAFGVVVAVAMAALVARWSRRRGWGGSHGLALAGAALLHQATTGFVLTHLYGRQGPIHIVGNVVFAIGAVALLLAAVRATRRSRDRGPNLADGEDDVDPVDRHGRAQDQAEGRPDH
jgi:hypothetical protein